VFACIYVKQRWVLLSPNISAFKSSPLLLTVIIYTLRHRQLAQLMTQLQEIPGWFCNLYIVRFTRFKRIQTTFTYIQHKQTHTRLKKINWKVHFLRPIRCYSKTSVRNSKGDKLWWLNWFIIDSAMVTNLKSSLTCPVINSSWFFFISTHRHGTHLVRFICWSTINLLYIVCSYI